MRILVVEDEARVARNIARFLREQANYAVDVSADGEDGLHMATTMQATSSLTTTDYYDGQGRLVEVKDPLGRFTKYQYDASDRLLGTYVGTHDVGGPTSIAGDRIVSQTIPYYDDTVDGRVWMTASYAYIFLTGGTGALTTSDSRVTYDVQWFDDLGRVIKDAYYGTNGGTAITDQTYDFDDSGSGTNYATAQMTTGTTGTGSYILTQYGYDGFGRNYQTTDNAASVTRTFYDSAGRQEYVVQNWQNGFNPATTVGSGDQDSVTEYAYNAAGLLSEQIAIDANANGGTTPQYQGTLYVYAMNLADNSVGAGSPVFDGSLLRATIYPDCTDITDYALLLSSGENGDFVATTYYANGAVHTKTDQNGTTHTYYYDDMGRLFVDSAGVTDSAVDTSVQAISYSYNAAGQVQSVTSWAAPWDPNSPPVSDDTVVPTNATGIVNQIQYAYDGWGNVSQCWQSHSGKVDTTPVTGSPSVRYTYDAYDRLSTVTYPSNQTITYNYYAGLQASVGRLGLLSNISDSSGILAQYDYLGDGTIVKITHPQVYLGLKLTVTLDQFGRVASQDWTVGADDILIDGYTYTYDAAGNVATKTNNMNSAYNEGYTYDGLNRLIDTTRGGSDYQNWTLDQLGNWTGFDNNGTSQTRTADAANQIGTVTQGGTDTTIAYDANGNMTFDGTYNYTYDAWNRLVQVKQTMGETTTTIATYAYDGNNYRISKTVGATTTDYYYNTSWQVVEEQQGGTMTAQYVWDARYIDTPICRFTPQTGGGTQTLYYTTDANNNVTALVNSYGSVVERYVYDSYGKVTVLNGLVDSQGNDTSANEWQPRTTNTFNNEVLYSGYRYNPETGNYNVRNRDLEVPLGGVWMQRDPAQSGPNLYEYVEGNPAFLSDPLGLATTQPASRPTSMPGSPKVVSFDEWLTTIKKLPSISGEGFVDEKEVRETGGNGEWAMKLRNEYYAWSETQAVTNTQYAFYEYCDDAVGSAASHSASIPSIAKDWAAWTGWIATIKKASVGPKATISIHVHYVTDDFFTQRAALRSAITNGNKCNINIMFAHGLGLGRETDPSNDADLKELLIAATKNDKGINKACLSRYVFFGCQAGDYNKSIPEDNRMNYFPPNSRNDRQQISWLKPGDVDSMDIIHQFGQAAAEWPKLITSMATHCDQININFYFGAYKDWQDWNNLKPVVKRFGFDTWGNSPSTQPASGPNK